MKGKSKLPEKIKIAFLLQESRMGGIEYNSVHLAGKMDPETFDVVFLCPGEGKLTSLLREKKIAFLFYRRPPFFSTSIRLGRRYIVNPVSTLYNFLCFFITAFSLAGLLRGQKFQVVFTKGLLANFYGSLAARIAGAASVWDMQEIVSGRKALGLFSFVQNLWAVVCVDRVIASSEAIRGQFSSPVRNKTRVVPNGIDTDFYSPRRGPFKVREEWKIAPNEVLISHIARLTYWKGQKDFIEAAAIAVKERPDIKFAVVGAPVFEDDNYEMELRSEVKRLGIENHVFFPGFRDDLADVLAASDIFVHSSTEPEGCPITLITAMSMGKPSVVTRVSGNIEIVTSQNQALLVPPAEAGEIAAAILKILKTSGLAETIGQNARRRAVERHSLESYASGCEEVFEDLV